MKTDGLWPLRRIQLETVNICNYNCPLCDTNKKDWVARRKIRVEEVKSIIRPVARQLEAVILYGTRGEPLLHKRLEGIVAYLKSSTKARVSISTNGSLLDKTRAARLLDAGLDQVVFAIDGVTQETYAKYRKGGRLSDVIRNLKKFCGLKKEGNYKTRVVFQFIPMAGNEHEVSDIQRFGYQLGVDVVRLKFSTSVSRSNEFRTNNAGYRPSLKKNNIFECPSGLDKLYIDPNGHSYPCCYAEGHKGMLVGNVLRRNINEIWNSSEMVRLRRSFSEQKKVNKFCINTCRYVARAQKEILPKPHLS